MSTNTDKTERLFAIGACSCLFIILMNILTHGAFNLLNKHLALSNNYQFASSITDSFMGAYAWSVVPSLLLTCLLIYKIFTYFSLSRTFALFYIIIFTACLSAYNYQSVDSYMFNHIKDFYDSISHNDDFFNSKYFEPMKTAIHKYDYVALKDLTNNPEVLKFKK